jgi:hypothetical protein
LLEKQMCVHTWLDVYAYLVRVFAKLRWALVCLVLRVVDVRAVGLWLCPMKMEATMQWIEMLDLFSSEALEFMFCLKLSHLSTFQFFIIVLKCFVLCCASHLVYIVEGCVQLFSNFHCWWLHSNALWFPSSMGAYCLIC